MNKKYIAILLAVLVILLAVGIASCGKTAKGEIAATTEGETEPTILETVSGADQNTESGVVNLDNAGPNTETKAPTTASEAEEETTIPAEEETKPEETTTPAEKNPDTPAKETTEYEKYLAMSGQQQKAFMESFDSIEAFFEWLNEAKAEYEAANPAIEIDDVVIDLGENAD